MPQLRPMHMFPSVKLNDAERVKRLKRKFFACTVLLASCILSGCFESVSGGKDAYDNHDYPRALQQFKPLAENGNAEAQYYMGLLYGNGDGVEQNPKVALLWFSKAATNGFDAANYNIGKLYLGTAASNPDEAIGEDDKKAIDFLTQAADSGYSDAEIALGDIYFNGSSQTKIDYAQAEKWYRQAQKAGNESASARLADTPVTAEYKAAKKQRDINDAAESRRKFDSAKDRGFEYLKSNAELGRLCAQLSNVSLIDSAQGITRPYGSNPDVALPAYLFGYSFDCYSPDAGSQHVTLYVTFSDDAKHNEAVNIYHGDKDIVIENSGFKANSK